MKELGSNIVAKLMVIVQGKTISNLEIPKGSSIVIGRGNDVNYQIKSGALSRKHCEINDKGSYIELRDLGSLNGTFVNHQRVESLKLKIGDQIQLGPIILQVESTFFDAAKADAAKTDAVKTDALRAEAIKTAAAKAAAAKAEAAKAEAVKADAAKADAAKADAIKPDAVLKASANPLEPKAAKPVVQPKQAVGLKQDGVKQEVSYTASTLKKEVPIPASPKIDGAAATSFLPKNRFLFKEPIRKIVLKKEYPSGPCMQCNKPLTEKEMACHAAVYKEDTKYCLSCFCGGAGNFPTIAGYRIIKKMGGGGMGDVYEAIQLSMERPVAFKLMKGLENANDAQVKRFFREARTGGKLNHPNIVGFIDAGKLEGACFIAMEFIYGMDVRQIIEDQGPIHYSEALRIAYYVANALEYANSRFNIVHRDVKPENILIDRDNAVKLTDFGLAKNLEEAGLSGITKSQTGVGTLFYMAPEQISDARFADQRADIYSLGISLYEMMTGIRPFVADQMMTLVNKIRYEQPTPLADMVPGVPTEVCAIINKAMAKDPAQRYQSGKEIMEVLDNFRS